MIEEQESEEDLKKFNNREEMKMANWLEKTLKQYTAKVIERKSQGRIFYGASEINELPIVVTSLRFSSEDTSDNAIELGNHTHNINDISITYSFCKDGVDRPQFFLCKSSRFYCNKKDYSDVDPNCLAINHEVDFFSKVIPDLEDWAFSKNLLMVLPIPYCYFSKLECTKVLKVDQRTKDYLTSIGLKYKVFPAANQFELVNAIDYDYEVNTVLLFENLSKCGFSKKKCFQLTVKEVHFAVEKLAQIHALSYAFTVVSDVSPKEDTKNLTETYLNALDEGFPGMLKLVKDYYEDKDPEYGETVITRLEFLQSKLNQKVKKVLRRVRFPLPNSIIHMDLNPNNILFQTQIPDHGLVSNFPFGLESTSPQFAKCFIKNETEEGSGENCYNNNSKDSNDCEGSLNDCRFVGWKESNYGSCLHDIANLLFTSLPIDTLHSSIIPVIQTYYRKFKAICSYLDVDIYFNCQMLYDEIPNSLLLTVLKTIKDLNDNEAKIDSTHFQHFVKMVEYLIDTNAL